MTSSSTNNKLTFKRFGILAILFIPILLFFFHTFIFNSSKLIVASDQLNGIGSRYIERDGLRLVQWDDSKLGGIPTLDATWGDAYHPLVFLQSITDPARAVGWKFVLTVYIAFLSGTLLFAYLSKHWLIGGFLGMLFALNPQFFTHIYGGHDGKMMVHSIAPLAILGILRTSKTGSWSGILLFIASLLYMLLTAHIQLVYFFLWGVLFYSLYLNFFQNFALSLKTKLWRQSLVGFGVALTLMLGAVQIIPPYQYTTTQSVRGTQEKTSMGHAVSWELHQEELASMFLPGFSGTDEQRTRHYWGHNVFKLNHDTPGMMLFLLAFCAFFIPTLRKEALFWFLGITLTVAYAIGNHSPFFQLFYQFVPGVKNFRAPAMVIFWLPLASGIMAARFLGYQLLEKEKRIPWTPLLSWLGILSILFVSRFAWNAFLGGLGIPVILAGMLLVNGGLWKEKNAPDSFSISAMLSGIFSGMKGVSKTEIILFNIPFLFLLLVALTGNSPETYAIDGGLFSPLKAALMQKESASVIGSFVIGLLIAASVYFSFSKTDWPLWKRLLVLIPMALVDTISVDKPFVQFTDRAKHVPETNQYLKWIQKHEQDQLNDHRVFTLPQTVNGNALPIFHLRNVAGSHDNEIASYRKFRGGTSSDNLIASLKRGSLNDNAFLNLLGAKYLLYPTKGGMKLAVNDSAMNRLTLYSSYQIGDEATILSQLQGHSLDYRKQVWFEQDPKFSSIHSLNFSDSTPSPSLGTAKITQSEFADDLKMEVNSSKPAILLFNENYHPYWKAFLNGKSIPIQKAFVTLMAVEVPQGKSSLEFKYQSDSVTLASKIVWAGILIILLSVIAMFVLQKKSKVRT